MNGNNPLLCISHLRWNFVYQRPQHLMTRAARDRRVYYVEEPEHAPSVTPHLQVRECDGVTVIVPQLPDGLFGLPMHHSISRLLQQYLAKQRVQQPVAWVLSPARYPVVEALDLSAVVYDCMDELANFKGAPSDLREHERALLGRADLVFTGGYHLWEAKRTQHEKVYPFPSSVDVAHFARARAGLPDPADQRHLPRPRLGFYGVLDERFDAELLREVAARRPEWQFVLLGPTAKIDPADLPHGENLHYLGFKPYQELPAYLAHWNVALLPFARNAATEFISPTKTPEYLAAGVPVVSTDIHDIVRPYGEQGIVRIARDADEFEAAIVDALREDNAARQRQADALLSEMSWDRTWQDMLGLIETALLKHQPMPKPVTNENVATSGIADD